jgi:hypothetical protein
LIMLPCHCQSLVSASGPPGGNVRMAAARELGTHAPPGRQCRDGQ